MATTTTADGTSAHSSPRATGSSLPAGFLGLFIATTSYAALQLNWIESTNSTYIAVAVLATTVPIQVIACVAGFAENQTTAGTAMGILAGTWAAVSVVTIISGTSTGNDALGVVLVCAGCAMVVPAVSGTGPPMGVIVMLLSSARFLVTGIAELTGSHTWLTTAGWVGLALAAASFYAALAVLADTTPTARRLPLGRPPTTPQEGTTS